MSKKMAPKKELPTNKRLLKLRGEMSQTRFARDYFGLALRTYQRYESYPDDKIPEPIMVLIELYEKRGLKIRD